MPGTKWQKFFGLKPHSCERTFLARHATQEFPFAAYGKAINDAESKSLCVLSSTEKLGHILMHAFVHTFIFTASKGKREGNPSIKLLKELTLIEVF